MIKTLRRLCPWDREQTHGSLVPEMIEEPLELVEEIKRNTAFIIKSIAERDYVEPVTIKPKNNGFLNQRDRDNHYRAIQRKHNYKK